MNCIEIDSPLGGILIADRGDGLAGVWFLGQRHFPADAEQWSRRETRILAAARVQLGAYFAGEAAEFELPLAPTGTPFQQLVWRQLRKIPHGQQASYAQIAQALDKPTASRAVGMAVGRNPWSIVVPCHRVIASNGQLTGYASGLARKLWLLTFEADQHSSASAS